MKFIFILLIFLSSVSVAKYNILPPNENGQVSIIASAGEELYCEIPPTVNEVLGGDFLTRTVTISKTQSGEFGFTDLFSGSASNNQHAYVFESYRSKNCLANDGKTMLEYGFAVRVGVSSNATEGSGEISLPFLAASATITNGYSSVKASRVGYNDASLDAAIVKAGSSPINVETFSEVNKNISDAATIASKIRDIDKLNVRLLGWLSPEPEDILKSKVYSVGALEYLAKRKSCSYATLKIGDAINDEIFQVYKSIMEIETCDDTKPSKDQQDKAKRILKI